MSEYRRERANAFIQQELTLALRDEVKDPRVAAVTITEVNLTPDRRVARVYVASFTGEDGLAEGIVGLLSARGVLRRHLAAVLHWRFTPHLEFRADRSYEYGARIDELLDAVADEEGGEPPEDDERPD